ncbi:hypothetical protein K438DRAFT_1832057 [Mycena galopus ATCC 62051]|nr:hypothetical protein K438DRAFT_1832057 [Mycena galopus ATCC 62051]
MSHLHINAAIRRAIIECIESPSFRPPAFPRVDVEDWDAILTNTSARDAMAVRGEEVLKFCLFLLLSDTLEGESSAFLQHIRGPISSAEFLTNVLFKIEYTLFAGIRQADGAFHVLIGYFWQRAGKDTAVIMEWLAKILGPLINAAKDACKNELKVPRKGRSSAAVSEQRNSRVSSDVKFLTLLRDLQLEEAADSDNSETSIGEVVTSESSSVVTSESSSPAIPSFDTWNLSPIDPVALARLTRGGLSPAKDQAARALSFDWVTSSASLPGPSNIESELGLPEPFDERPENPRSTSTRRALSLLLPSVEVLHFSRYLMIQPIIGSTFPDITSDQSELCRHHFCV